MATDLAAEQLTTLLRSAWVIERGRSASYSVWARSDPAYAASITRCDRRAELIGAAISDLGHPLDESLVELHTRWLLGVIGEQPGAIALSNFFISRLGDWVDAHAGPFLGEGAEEMQSLQAEDKEGLSFPDGFPQPPGYSPFDIPDVQAPGEVLFRFAILGDAHIGSPHSEELLAAAIADINASGAALTVQLGDLSDHGASEEIARARALLDELEMPWEAMTGNHDMFDVSEQRLAGREYFEATFGRPADGTMIEHEGFNFVLLDSAEEARSPFPPYDIVAGSFANIPGGAVVRGSLTSPQHDLLADIAGPGGGPAFVFLHHPTQPFAGLPPILFGLSENDSGRLHAVCDSGNVWGIFAGHTHRNIRTTEYSGVPVQEVGVPRDFPHGYALVDVAANGYAYRFVQLSDEDLLRRHYARSSEIQRRYAGGSGAGRAFSWTGPAPTA